MSALREGVMLLSDRLEVVVELVVFSDVTFRRESDAG